MRIVKQCGEIFPMASEEQELTWMYFNITFVRWVQINTI